jgi:hypothetical protein
MTAADQIVRSAKKSACQGGPSTYDFVGQWKTVRRDDQCDHDLHAIGTLVAAVTELPLAIARRIAFEIGAGQIIQEHVEIGLKQVFPALAMSDSLYTPFSTI